MTKKRFDRFLFGSIFVVGCGMIAISLAPFWRGWSENWRQAREQAIVFPLNMDEFLALSDSGPKILGEMTTTDAKDPVIVAELDYGNIENWFTTGQVHAQKQTSESYILEIDKLNIKNAIVKVGGVNIDHNLVQFNTDVQVGGFGAPVIFGHSMLRQFYNPKETNKDRYKGLFSTIMTLELGDEIRVITDEATYTYLVIDVATVQPDDEFILRQDPSHRQLKLVTCTPEGTKLRRGVVTAQLKV